jgi:hypothetical protein
MTLNTTINRGDDILLVSLAMSLLVHVMKISTIRLRVGKDHAPA